MSIYDFYTNNELLTLRTLIKSDEASLLIRFLGDYVTETATKTSLHAEEIKGMAILLHKVKTSVEDIENQLKNRK